MSAYILHNNALEQSGATVTTLNSISVDHPLANCYDYKLHTSTMQGSSGDLTILIDAGASDTISADYLGFFGSNLADEVTAISLDYLDGADWVSHVSITAASGDLKNGVNVGIAATVETYRFWRVFVEGGTTDAIYEQIMIGQSFKLRPLNKGFRPPVYQHYNAVSKVNLDANFIGRSVRKAPIPLTIKQTAIEPADFRANYVPFLEHANDKPFFFCWDYENFPGESVYCWRDDRAPNPVYSHLCFMAIDLKVKAVFK